MNRTVFALSLLAVVAAAAWSYHVNYRTGAALSRVAALKAEIRAERARIGVLDVEWAHLNAPDRLRRLVAEHNATLQLMPLGPAHMGEAVMVPFPPRSADIAAIGGRE